MVFKNEAQLRAFILKKSQSAVVAAEEKVHRTIDECLNQFYDEFDPEEYIRTSQLLHSLVRSGIKSTGNGYEAEVYFDVDALNYAIGVVPTRSGTGYATWSGEKVLDVAMTSAVPHGGYASGTAIWSVSMAKLGDIKALLVQELRNQGVPIVG